MHTKLPVLALTATLASAGTAGLVQDARNFVVRGMGSLGCETLVSALEQDQRQDAAARLVAWLSGYLSHANRAETEVIDVLPFSNVNELATVVARVCASNTNAQVEAVTASVLATLAPLAVTQKEEAVELRRGETAIIIRPSVLQAIQDRLIALELLPQGSADGVFGEQSAQAIASFQSEVNLQATGLPDAWTVFLLQAAR